MVKRVSAADEEVEDRAPTVHVSSTESVDADADEDEDEDEDAWGRLALKEVAPRNAFVALPTVHPVDDEQPGMAEQPTRVWSGC